MPKIPLKYALSFEKAVKMKVDLYCPPERGSHWLKAFPGSCKGLKFPSELHG